MQKHSKLTAMPPPWLRYGVTNLGKNAAIFLCIGRDEESIPGSLYKPRGRHSVSHSSLSLRGLVILFKSIFCNICVVIMKYLFAALCH